MIYWKEECQGLAKYHSVVVLVDRYDENRIPVFAIRQAQSAVGSRSGKNSYWSITFDEPLSDGCNAVTFPFILATLCQYAPYGVVLNPTRLDEYHPAWVLNANQEKELEWRKESVIHGLEQMANDLK